MTDITDRHTLRRMSWSELITAGQEAEFQRDYEPLRFTITLFHSLVLICLFTSLRITSATVFQETSR